MQLQTQPEQEPEINLTSLIDVVFLLLIFFMVSTTFERQAALKVELPHASVAPDAETEAIELNLIIDASGRMYLNDRQLVDNEPETIAAALQEAAGDERDLPLLLRADARTPHQFVVRAMDVSGQLGFSRLSIATVHDAEPDE
ncbi:MAG: biopolymer transporter ExbD [Xanthomonadales bacterium]|nr:biopolymer transporter ExbD [Xanthomonadales bacterium]NIN60674.1 biopolymer transporter ExbD [Xanthomonadales bacterium]NIN75535.1 biopolymer transporter ExbD [Xanthomonadales bacterium]NIO15295.1 biopolymer transporter ExbD [Xanthomonadales bacterium]NIP13067.1 biopolymer transporter ExbD [Xanthomonadales bacterium]